MKKDFGEGKKEFFLLRAVRYNQRRGVPAGFARKIRDMIPVQPDTC
jgi:hypothetical protein